MENCKADVQKYEHAVAQLTDERDRALQQSQTAASTAATGIRTTIAADTGAVGGNVPVPLGALGAGMSDVQQKRVLTQLVKATRRIYKAQPAAMAGAAGAGMGGGHKMSMEEVNRLGAASLQPEDKENF